MLQQKSVVLLRFSKSCKRAVSDWFVKKSADSDSVSDSRRRQPQADVPCARQQCRGRNHLGRSPGKARTHRPAGRDRTSPRPSTLHCPICARAAASTASDNYLKLRSDACLDWYDWPDSGEGGEAAVRLFNLPHSRPHRRPHTVDATSLERRHLTREQTTQNHHLRPQKNSRIQTRTDSERICGFGCGFGIRNNTRNQFFTCTHNQLHMNWDGYQHWYWQPEIYTSIHAGIRSVFANFLTLKMLHTLSIHVEVEC